MAKTMVEVWMEQGEARGIELGELREAKRAVRAILQARFGEFPESVAQRLDALNDLNRLRAAMPLAATVANIEEFQP